MILLVVAQVELSRVEEDGCWPGQQGRNALDGDGDGDMMIM